MEEKREQTFIKKKYIIKKNKQRYISILYFELMDQMDVLLQILLLLGPVRTVRAEELGHFAAFELAMIVKAALMFILATAGFARI